MIETVTCPQCKKRLQLSAELLGMTVQCPSCETAFTAGEAPPPMVIVPTPPGAITTPATVIPDMSLDAPSSEPRAKKKHLDDDDDSSPMPPRAKRRALPQRPKAPSNYRVPILFAVLAGLVLLGIVIGFWTNRDPRQPQRPIVFGNDVDNTPREWEMPPRTEVPDRVLAEDEQKAQASTFFQHYSMAMRNRTIVNQRAAFDAKRMVDRMFEQNVLPIAWRGESEQLTRLLRERIIVTPLNPSLSWTNFEVKHIKHAQPRELIVVTRHPHQNFPGALRFRWWLKHDGTRWLIHDMEDIDYGIRMSTLLALTMEPFPNNTGVFPDAHLRTISSAADGILLNSNFVNAEQLLKDARTDHLARPIVALHHLLLASSVVRQRRYQDTLRSCEIAQNAEPDMPGNNYLLSLSMSNLNRNDEALKHIEKARAWLGEDSFICYQHGFVLHHLRRYPEAAVQYRKVLDFEPDHQDAFLSLIRIVGHDVDGNDIADRLGRVKNPQERFVFLANDSWMNRNIVALEVLATAMRQRAPRYAEAEFYYSLAMAEKQNVPVALASFRQAVKLQLDGPRREYYATEFVRAMAAHDHAAEVYEAMTNPSEAFRAIAESLKNTGRMDELQQLIHLHAKKNPDDAYLHLYQAEIHLREEKFALADSTFAKAFANINDLGLEDRFRMDRVRARYQTGDFLGAYREFPPQRMTFPQVAELCWLDKKYDDLQKLIDLHAKNDEVDPQLARYRTRLDFAHKRFEEAGNKLKATLGPNLPKEQSRQLMQSFLIDAVDAGHALEAYRQCPHPELALELLADDLLDLNQPKVLDDILEEHRKRFPQDPYMYILLGDQASMRQEWPKAAQAFKQGWAGLPEIKRQRWSYAYLQARNKVGEALQVHQENGKRFDYFRQLASMILFDKNVDLFEKLLESQRAAGANEPELAAYEARLQILRGKPADAAQRMVAYLKDLPQNDQHRIGDTFANDLGNFEHAVEVYRCIPNKIDAFAQMTFKYRTPERAKELDRLIQEHAKFHPNDPRLASERAELHMLRGEFKLAETQFQLANANEQRQKFNPGRYGLVRARIKLGKAVETYNELGKTGLVFQEVANECVRQKETEQLERLLKAHREAFPKATNLAIWNLDLHWTKKDYEKTLQTLRADNSALLKNIAFRWKAESYLIRSLVHLKKSDEAVREAEIINQRKFGPQILLALALSSTGDAKRTIAYLENASNRFLIEDCYHDEDLGPILRGEAYRDLQKRFPPPPLRPKLP